MVTFTIESKNSVSTQGVMPPDASVSYVNTYKKGQLTAGNSASLILSHWEGVEIDDVTIHMRSNKSSGAGSLSLHDNSHTYWQIPDTPFADSEWYGAYTTDTVVISHEFLPAIACQGQELELLVTASANSLVLVSYQLTYHKAQKRPYTVNFVSSVGSTPADMTEDGINTGIILPDISWTNGDWHFAGWSTSRISYETNLPKLYTAGSRYYPTADETLYSVFTNSANAENPFPISTQEIARGEYILVHYPTLVAWSGEPDNGSLGYEMVKVQQAADKSTFEFLTPVSEEDIYSLSRATDSTIYIRHYLSDQPVGISKGLFAAEPDEWLAEVEEGGTIRLSICEDDICYQSTMTIVTDKETGKDIGALQLSEYKEDQHFLLFPIEIQETIYTGDPLRFIESVPRINHIPEAAKILRDGVIRIQTANGEYYNLLGIKL